MDFDATASELLLALDRSDFEGLYRRFADFLSPFGELVPLDFRDSTAAAAAGFPAARSPMRRSKKPGNVRPLAKQFLPFLCRSLQFLPGHLRRDAKSVRDEAEEDQGRAMELLAVYGLALDCLDCLSPCLAGKPFSVHMQRTRRTCCLEAWGRYREAEDEGLSVLKSLCSLLDSSASFVKGCDELSLPDPSAAGTADAPELAALFTELIACLICCAHKSASREAPVYRRILSLVEHVEPWLRLLDPKTNKRCQSMLVNNLFRCSLFLAREASCFDGDLVGDFCLKAARECLRTSSEDPFRNVLRICSSVDMKWKGRPLFILEILSLTLESATCSCKAVVNGCLEAVSYLCDAFSSLSSDICCNASNLLYQKGSGIFQVLPAAASIFIIYAFGLIFKSRNGEKMQCDDIIQSSKNTSITILFDGEANLSILKDSLVYIMRYFEITSLSSDVASNHQNTKCSFENQSAVQKTDKFGDRTSVFGHPSFSSYFDALEFLFKASVDYVNNTWNIFSSSRETMPYPIKLNLLQDAFHCLCDLFLSSLGSSKISESDRERLHGSHSLLIQVSVSGLKLSFITSEGQQKCKEALKCVISNRWIAPDEIRFLRSSLQNVAISLYNTGKLDEALMTMKLCHIAVWMHVKVHYDMNKDNSKCVEDVVRDLTREACTKTAWILDFLHKCQDIDIGDIVAKSLFYLYVEKDISFHADDSSILVEQWIKLVYKKFKDVDSVEKAPLLYSLLDSYHSSMSMSVIGNILEQELHYYEITGFKNRNLCAKMEADIIGILLDEIYTAKSFYFQRSKILIRKGRSLRALGAEDLSRCMDCLSEGISLLQEHMSSGSSVSDFQIRHQMAIAHCLHAQCVQEFNQDCKVILQDIHCALSLWLNMETQGYCFSDEDMKLAAKSIPLLCSTADLLSLKGNLDCHTQIYKLLILFYKRGSVPIEKCLALLWNDKRLNHALCSFSIDKSFLLSASQDLGLGSNSLDFWMSCMKNDSVNILGFLQNLMPCDSIVDDLHKRFKICADYKVSADEVKKAALSLISQDPLETSSAFKASNIYYDLSERFIFCGRLVEAIKYAKDALALRQKILRRKFIFSLEQQNGDLIVTGRKTQNINSEVSLELERFVAAESWPDMQNSRNNDRSILSPWNILRSYLESIFQVASLHESSGNCVDAENLLLTGKRISTLQGLPVFGIAFSSLLGRLYRKKQLWDLAETEINAAKNILLENDDVISCKDCKLMFDVANDMQSGDLSRDICKKGSQNESSKNISHALGMYRCAIGKLNNQDNDSSFDTSGKVNAPSVPPAVGKKQPSFFGICTCFNQKFNIPQEGSSIVVHGVDSFDIQNDKIKADMEVKDKVRSSSRQRNKVQNLDAGRKPATRSRRRTTENDNIEVNNNEPKSAGRYYSHHVSTMIKPGVDGKTTDANGNIDADMCNKTKCWRCLALKVVESGSMICIINLKSVHQRQHILMKLLSKIGRCLGIRGGHEAHEVFLQRVSILIGGYPFLGTCAGIPFLSLMELMASIPLDIFPIERAIMFYDISWLYLKDFFSENQRTSICCLSDIRMSNIIPWLLRALILGRELPLLLQKVCMLIACLLLISTLDDLPLSFFNEKSLSLSHWAAYFHQASISAGSQCRFVSCSRDGNAHCTAADESSSVCSLETETKGCRFLSYVPEKLENLEKFVKEFYRDLPEIPVICVSMLGGDFVNLIGEALLQPLFSPAWMLFSRFFSSNQPLTILLPVDFVQEGILSDVENGGKASAQSNDSVVRAWECPWGNSIIDYVAPSFKMLLEENFMFLSKVSDSGPDEQQNCITWWSQRKRLDKKMNDLLRCIEDSWFGSWACLLLGDHLELENRVAVDKLVAELKTFAENENVLKAILGGSRSASDAEACLHQLLIYKGYFGRGACCGKDSFRIFKNSYQGAIVMPKCPLEVIGLPKYAHREPIVLILDSSVQMLPWESLPTLRSQEVYRMPSMRSIFASLNFYEQQAKDFDVFPSIDPFNAFYLLNPSGDLYETQAEFEQWFLNQKFKGYAGSSPMSDELALALQSHDLFLYLGHGNGTQYISGNRIQKLDRCAATLLMGCSSGCLKQQGCYPPHGAPLSYLSAGSPAIVANLWDVTDKDIDRFAKAILGSWLQTKDPPAATTSNLGEDDNAATGRRRRGQQQKKLAQHGGNSDGIWEGWRRWRTMASPMSGSRDACKMPFLIGASPVCYGVPTILRKQQQQ